jgi:hypothetical protein
MSTLVRIMLIRGRGIPGNYTGEYPPSPPPPLPLCPDKLIENTDYGVVKVENGKLVFDMPDFDADFGRY